MAMLTLSVTPAEFDIILAGLRALAQIQQHNGIHPDSMLGGIITNMGKNPIPDTGTIEALGDRLNYGD